MWDNLALLVLSGVIIYVIKQIFSCDPNRIQFGFKYFLYDFLIIFIAAVIWPYFLLKPKNVRNLRVSAEILKDQTKFFGIKWTLRNKEILSEDRGAVIVGNHQSILDILGMSQVWPVANKMTAVVKKEAFYIWPFGLAAYLGGMVFVDRKNPKDAYEKLNAVSEIMVKKKTKIWFFPEGTRNNDPSKLMPFKKGAFITAVSAQVPIIPVVISRYYFIKWDEYIFNKGEVIIQCLEPEPTEGLTKDDIPALVERVQHKMEAVYSEISKEVLKVSTEGYAVPQKVQ